eukprot:3079174-Pyramimonas_sp.AAC.1
MNEALLEVQVPLVSKGLPKLQRASLAEVDPEVPIHTRIDKLCISAPSWLLTQWWCAKADGP